MIFNKRHYIALAQVFFDNMDCSIIKDLCELFANDNPEFDTDKFKKMCGYDFRYDQEPDWGAIDKYVNGTGPHPNGRVRIMFHS